MKNTALDVVKTLLFRWFTSFAGFRWFNRPRLNLNIWHVQISFHKFKYTVQFKLLVQSSILNQP